MHKQQINITNNPEDHGSFVSFRSEAKKKTNIKLYCISLIKYHYNNRNLKHLKTPREKERQNGDNCEENVSELMEEQGNTKFDRNLVIEAGQKRRVVGRPSAAEERKRRKRGEETARGNEGTERRGTSRRLLPTPPGGEPGIPYRGAKSLYLG